MANTKISQMPNLANPTGDTIAPVVKSGVNYSVTMANVAAYVNSNATDITATGNITGGNIIGNGQYLTSIAAGNIVGTVANAAYATTSGTASVAYSVSAANVVGTVANAAYATVAGTAYSVAAGNIVGTIANAAYADAAGTAYSVAAGNIVGTVANAAYATTSGTASVAYSVAAANVVGTVANATYATSAGSATTATTAGLATYVTGNAQANITSLGTLTSLTASGNISGNYILGNGSLLTGLPATYSNANVTSLLASFGSNTISTTGNITAGYFIGNGSQLTGITVNYSNANVTALMASFGSNTISTTGNVATGNLVATGTFNATGNIAGNYFNGNGAALTGVVTIDGTQTVSGSKTFTGTTTLYPYVEYTNNTGLTTGTSFTPTTSNGPVQKVTANGNFSLNAPSGMSIGQSITLIIRQDATGSRVMTPNAVYKFAYGVNTLSTAANAIDMMSIFYDGTNYLCNLVKGYA